MGRYNIDEYLAALNRLPWQQFANPKLWDQNKQLLGSGLTGSVLDVLDGLAAMCLQESSESYSTALLFEEDAIKLFVASSCGEVPDSVEQHLQSIWQHMRAIHAHEDAPAVRRGEVSRAGYVRLCCDFGLAQYRFAMPAVRARLADEAPAVVKALRSVLRCYAPHTAAVAAHLDDYEYVHNPVPAADRQFLERCVTSLEDLRRIATSDNLTDAIVLHILRTMEDLNTEFKNILSKGDATFRTIEAISDIPARSHLQRIFWLSDACATIPAFAVSQRFAPWAPKRLLVMRMPAMYGPAPPAPNVNMVATMAAMISTADSKGQAGDIRRHLLEPLQALVRERELLTGSEPAPNRWQLHGEMVILHHLGAYPQQSVIYIGHSELSCLHCFLFLRAYNLHGARRFYVRGTHGRTPLRWIPPQLHSDTDTIYKGFSSRIADAFFRAWGNRSKAEEVERGVRTFNEDEGHDDSDLEDEDDGYESDYYINRFTPEHELPLAVP